MEVKFPDETGEEKAEEIEIKEISVGDLLKRLGFNPFSVIVMKNCEVVGEREILTNEDKVKIL